MGTQRGGMVLLAEGDAASYTIRSARAHGVRKITHARAREAASGALR